MSVFCYFLLGLFLLLLLFICLALIVLELPNAGIKVTCYHTQLLAIFKDTSKETKVYREQAPSFHPQVSQFSQGAPLGRVAQ